MNILPNYPLEFSSRETIFPVDKIIKYPYKQKKTKISNEIPTEIIFFVIDYINSF